MCTNGCAMDKRSLIKAFWSCGDNDIIEFALLRARLNRHEKEVLQLTLDDCLTQEQASEKLSISTRKFQDRWYSAVNKLLAIPWVMSYSMDLLNK